MGGSGTIGFLDNLTFSPVGVPQASVPRVALAAHSVDRSQGVGLVVAGALRTCSSFLWEADL